MLVFLIVGLKYMLVTVRHARPPLVSHGKYADRRDRKTDGYMTLSVDAASIITDCKYTDCRHKYHIFQTHLSLVEHFTKSPAYFVLDSRQQRGTQHLLCDGGLPTSAHGIRSRRRYAMQTNRLFTSKDYSGNDVWDI